MKFKLSKLNLFKVVIMNISLIKLSNVEFGGTWTHAIIVLSREKNLPIFDWDGLDVPQVLFQGNFFDIFYSMSMHMKAPY